jgi:hypothetical protein
MDERWLGDVDIYTLGSEPTSRNTVVDAVERLLGKHFDYGSGNLHFDIRVYEVDGQTASHRFREQAGS